MIIIKSHIRGDWRGIRDYLTNEGRFADLADKNEVVRLIGGQNVGARDVKGMLHEMWLCRGRYPTKTPVHHCSINPDPKGRKLTDDEVWRIVERMKQKFWYDKGSHQCVVVEHIYKGRQHFHVVFNRIEMLSLKPVWPGNQQIGHWLRAKMTAREMERELGLEPGWSRKGRGRLYTAIKRQDHYARLKKLTQPVQSVKNNGQKLSNQSSPNHTAKMPRHEQDEYSTLSHSSKVHGQQNPDKFSGNRNLNQLKYSVDPTTRHLSNFAGLSGEYEAVPKYVAEDKGDKTGKGDGAGGGMMSGLSALKTSPKNRQYPKHYKPVPKDNRLDRRRKTAWVAVERRDNGPKLK